jgi:alpha-D-ribose 1-methylphosphonate 5-triphosphate synthase subunit PhnL
MDMIVIENAGKSFTLHHQGGIRLDVMRGVSLSVRAGECVALTGVSGAGKSSLMRMIHGNYLTETGHIRVRHREGWVDVATASPHEILALRRESLGYVSQFLRVIPRVPTLDVVAEPLLALGQKRETARARAATLLERLRVPRALWSLSPTTFSGGEQQRVNIARGFAHPYPALLVDEPTASLDAANRETVLDLIREAKAAGTAIIGIFHDIEARVAVCDREFAIEQRVPA